MGASTREAQLGEIESLARDLAESTRTALDCVREARGELPPQSGLLAFVHIPKTAGGTVVNMLGSAYSRRALHDSGNYVVGPDKAVSKLSRRNGGWLGWEQRGGRVTAGHVPYAVYRQYLPQGARYMTFLRDPIHRVMSHYHAHIHHKRLEGGGDRSRDVRKPLTRSIEEALELGLPMVCNLSTRFLCGDPVAMRRLPESALDEAKANLGEFAFVGIQERFEESMVLLQRLLDLELTPYVNRHVSVGPSPVEDLTTEQRQLILEHNRLDAELYSFACERFQEAVGAAGDDFAAAAEELGEISRDVNEDAVRRARELLDRELPVGATRKKRDLFAAAKEAGVPAAALKYASKIGVKKHGNGPQPDGSKIWVRTG